MGYDVFLTRKEEWSDENGPSITESEWRSYVASDPEMVIVGVIEHTNPHGEVIRVAEPLLTEWRQHSGNMAVWFSYSHGCFSVKNPDDECLAKMRRIAVKLQARVQGEEGEFYDESTATQKTQEKTSWVSRLFRR